MRAERDNTPSKDFDLSHASLHASAGVCVCVLCVCVCVCVHVCYMYTYICICMYVCMYISRFLACEHREAADVATAVARPRGMGVGSSKPPQVRRDRNAHA